MNQQETYNKPNFEELEHIYSKTEIIMQDFEERFSKRSDFTGEYDMGYTCCTLIKVVSVISRYFLYLNKEEQDEVLELLEESLQQVKASEGETKRMIRLWSELFKYRRTLIGLEDDDLLGWKKNEK